MSNASPAPVPPLNGPDLRLATPAVGAWLSALWALHTSPRAALGVATAAGVAVATLWRLRYRNCGGAAPATRGKVTVVISLLLGALLGVLSGAVATTARTSVRLAEPFAGLIRQGATVRADLMLTDDPRATQEGRGWLMNATLTRLRPTFEGPAEIDVRLSARVLVIGRHPTWQGMLPGQRVSVSGRLAASRGGDLRAAVLLTTEAPRRHGQPAAVQRMAGRLREGLRSAAAPLPDEEGGLLPGLAIGDVSRMDPAVEEDFRVTGMSHLTAVSGSNITIVTGMVLLLAAWCRAGPRLSAALALLALVGFVILVRPSPSVLRAAAMGALGLVALASSRPRAAVPGLAWTVYLLVLIDPELAGDPGFALSVLATAGLLFLAPRWRDAMRRRKVPAGIAEALAVPLAAQVACAPVIAALTGTVSMSAVPANMVAAPAVAPATILGAAAATISPLWPDGAEFLAWLGSWPAGWLVAVARWGAELPNAAVPWPDGTWGGLVLALALCGLIVLTLQRSARRLLAVILAAAVLGVSGVRIVADGWPPPAWVLVACDVGQGDAIAIRTGPARAIVIDAGPRPASVDRCLRRLEITTVPLLVISHFHIDHIGGVPGVLRHRDVGAVVLPGFREPRPGVDEVTGVAAHHRVPVREATPGWHYHQPPVQMEVLGPDRPQTGTRSDPNNNSLVLRVTYRGFTILLPGDAEVERQRALLTAGGPVRADLLKLPHHGSAYQDLDFLSAVDPAVVIVSVGADNEYGHPHVPLLRRLSIDGARVFRTDHAGDIAVSRSAEGLLVTSRGQEAGQNRS